MFDGRHIHYGTDDTSKKDSVHWYRNWLVIDHTTRWSALKEAVRRNFAIKDDEFVSQTLRDAYSDLQQSKDPAVQYYVRTLAYLPKGSQRRNPDAVPEVEWFGQDQTRGMIVTPAGICLGFIEKYPDGGWGIMPQEEGLVQVTDIAESVADAKDYLVNRLTGQVTVTIKGESRQLRIVSEKDFFPLPVWTPGIDNPADLMPQTQTYELEFRYYISSLESDAKRLLQATRSHWGIENSLHWVLDLSFREDESRVRSGNAPENLALIRHMALNLLRQDRTSKTSIKARRKKAGWDNDYLAAVLSS